MHIYGIVNREGIHIDVSKSERGAKSYATRHGYAQVSIRYNSGYIAQTIAVKSKNGRWTTVIATY